MYSKCERITKKVNSIDELYVQNYDLSNGEYFNLGLNFRQRISNFALSLSSDFQFIGWNKVVILIDFKDKKKKLFEATYQAIFYKDESVIYSVRNIGLKKHTYNPFIIGN